MYLPNYENGSIVNLMSSISSAFGKKGLYKELKLLPSSELKDCRNVILIVMDGLGYESLTGYKNLNLKKYLIGKMTSVFPSTTAACLTTFATGLPPQQSGVVSWYMNLKELGMVVKILPYTPRVTHESLFKMGIDPSKILNLKTIFENVSSQETECFNIVPRIFLKGGYSRVCARGSKVIGYRSPKNMISKIIKVVKSSKKRKMIYCYSPLFDSACHEYGTKSKEAEIIAYEFDKGIKQLMKNIECTRTTTIITADHGLIDNPPESRINLNKHSELLECLSLPLCGESRAAFCYVKVSKIKQFKSYFQKELSKQFIVKTGEELMKKNYFGLYKPNDKTIERVGDFVLLAKDNYTIKDFIYGEDVKFLEANHGGLSKEEMFVPLVVIKS